jgi:hypothetical protein
MYNLIVLFFEIAILRKGPQDVPASPWMIRLLIPVYFVINLLILLVNSFTTNALAQILVEFLLLIGFCWPLLYFSGKSGRFAQTFSAFLGTDAVISFFAIPVVVSLNSNSSDLALFGMLLLMVWHWLVSGHIFRHALDKPLFFGLALSLLYILISSQVMEILFPVASNPT